MESLPIRQILNDKSFEDLHEDMKALLHLLNAVSLVKIRLRRRFRRYRVVPKVRIQGVNEWLACKYMKLVPQITGCKRRSCTCSHLGYSLDSRVISECKISFVSI
jgi:hypothetical protein